MSNKAPEGAQHFSVELTDEAYFSLVDISSKRVVEHVVKVLTLLGSSPFLGQNYDPVYEAAKPDAPCRVLYCEFLGIYYRVDEKAYRVTVIAIVDQRRDPASRF